MDLNKTLDDLIKNLRNCYVSGLFYKLSAYTCKVMIENSEIKRFGANIKIYEEGATANSLFFILSGKILLKKSEVGIFA